MYKKRFCKTKLPNPVSLNTIGHSASQSKVIINSPFAINGSYPDHKFAIIPHHDEGLRKFISLPNFDSESPQKDQIDLKNEGKENILKQMKSDDELNTWDENKIKNELKNLLKSPKYKKLETKENMVDGKLEQELEKLDIKREQSKSKKYQYLFDENNNFHKSSGENDPEQKKPKKKNDSKLFTNSSNKKEKSIKHISQTKKLNDTQTSKSLSKGKKQAQKKIQLKPSKLAFIKSKSKINSQQKKRKNRNDSDSKDIQNTKSSSSKDKKNSRLANKQKLSELALSQVCPKGKSSPEKKKRKKEEDFEKKLIPPNASNELRIELLSQPSPSLSHRELLEWLRDRRNVGVWIECCNRDCSKWRYEPNIKDPANVPEEWFCNMNSDKKLASCNAPESAPSATIDEDLIFNKYTAGSIVWARMKGYPWWPAMVDDCPDTEQYYWLDGFSDTPVWYHVVFFDDSKTERCWIEENDLQHFKTGKEHVTKNFKHRINVAKRQALEALAYDLPDRLKKYGFLARWKGPINTPLKKGDSDIDSNTSDIFDLDNLQNISNELSFEISENDHLNRNIKKKQKKNSAKRKLFEDTSKVNSSSLSGAKEIASKDNSIATLISSSLTLLISSQTKVNVLMTDDKDTPTPPTKRSELTVENVSKLPDSKIYKLTGLTNGKKDPIFNGDKDTNDLLNSLSNINNIITSAENLIDNDNMSLHSSNLFNSEGLE